MRDLARSLGELETLSAWWLEELDRYSEEDLKRVPFDGSWTMGQLYQHLVDAVVSFAVPKIDHCLEPGREPATSGKTLVGSLFFLIGGFPPIRVKVPGRRDYAPRQPESKDEARLAFAGSMDAARAAAARAAAALPGRKSRHPAFGMLDAAEWVEVMRMHAAHHVRQKRRIDEALRGT